MVTAANLDRRVAFQSWSEVSDGGGGYSGNWVTQFTLWGGLDIRQMFRREMVEGGAISSPNTAKLTIRDGASARLITDEWRALTVEDNTISPAENMTWNIRKVYPRERDGYLRFEVEMGVAV